MTHAPASTWITYGMMLSLDGYIAARDGSLTLPPPEAELHAYWNQMQRDAGASICGRKMYEMMRYWDSALDNPESTPVERAFAEAWQATPKLVFSTTLAEVGPNARLVRERDDDKLREAVSALRSEVRGRIDVSGAELAQTFARLSLIDEYELYFLPIVLGDGRPFFEPGNPRALTLVATERLPQDVVLARYRPVRASA